MDGRQQLSRIQTAAGVVAGILGLIVLVGWHVREELLLQVHPSFVPMQYNTALAFVLAGASILAFAHRHVRTLCALGTVLTGGLTAFQYLTGTDLGIDELFMTYYVEVETAHPGRMAPNTAVCFSLSGLGALLLAVRPTCRASRFVVAIIASIVLALSVGAVVGYSVGFEPEYGWGGWTRMAVHTAVGFALVSVGLVTAAANGFVSETRVPAWLAPAAVVFVLTSSAATAYAAATHERVRLRRGTDRELEVSRVQIERGFDQKVLALTRMARRWEAGEVRTRALWSSDAAAYARDMPGYQAVLWTDRSGRARWVVPEASNQRYVDAELAGAPGIGSALANARDDRGFAVSDPFPLAHGSTGLAVAIPVREDGDLAGAVIGVFRCGDLLDALVPAAPGYAVEIRSGDALLFERHASAPRHDGLEHEERVDMAGVALSLRVWPTEWQIGRSLSFLPWALFLGGVTVALLLGAAIQIGSRAALHAARLAAVNEELTEEIRNRESAERRATLAYSELEAFSYSVSHDLRAPLRHMLGFVELLRKRAQGLDERSERYIQIVSESGERMGTLIDDLLQFSRSARTEMIRSSVRLDDLVAACIRELAPSVGGRTIHWNVHELPVVHGDEAMLRQVVVNLVSNAVKYTRDSDPATIEIGTRQSADEIVVFVRDNGVGFDMTYADKLFRVFQRLHRAEEFEGTGIGLASVRRIVRRHGGRVWAESTVGAGATFFFALPTETRS